MNGGPLWGEVLLALVALVAVLWFVRWTKKADRKLGRRAFLDGLSYNPKWGDDIAQGWREARAEFERSKLRRNDFK